jgi:DNA-binding NarL/FixJ family response regulator
LEIIRVVIAEDHHVVRAAVATFLSREPDILVIGEVADGSTLLEAVDLLRPDILLLDAHMPGHKVIHSMYALRETHPTLRVLVLSAHNSKEYVNGLISAGACGYVLKDDPADTLAQALRVVYKGGTWLSPRIVDLLVKPPLTEDPLYNHPLSDREIQVLDQMVKGLRNDKIADNLCISEHTVKNHIRSIFSKLGVETRVDAILYAINTGLSNFSETDR